MTKIMEEQEQDQESEVDIPPPPAEGEFPQRVRTHNRPRRQAPSEESQRGYQRGFDPTRRGPRPLDLAQHQDESFLRVSRVKVNQADEEEVGLGFAGMVDDELGYEDEIAKRWGGGSYEVRGMYDGQLKSTRVQIAGKSRPIHRDKNEEEGETEDESSEVEWGDSDEWTPPRRSGRGRRPFGGYETPYDGGDPYGRSGGYGGYRDPYTPTTGPHGLPPYAPGPYGQPHYVPANQGPYGQPPNPYAAPANPYHAAQGAVAGAPVYQKIEPEKNEELEAMREQLEAMRAEAQEAREQAALEREERRIEAAAAAAREREELLRRELESMKADSERKLLELQKASERQALEMKQSMEAMVSKLTNNKPDMITKMIELQVLQQQQQAQQAERERHDRDTRMREEQIQRREESDRREKERQEAIDRQEKEYRREKERQDELRREEQAREERRREAAERQAQKVMELHSKSQQTPEQVLGMLKTMIDLNPRQNATSQVMELAQAAMAMRDMLGGNQEAENKWEGMVRAGGEALVGAIETIKGSSATQTQQPQAPQQLQHQPHQPQPAQPHQLPGPGPQRSAQTDINRMPEAEDWGRILAYVVDSFSADNDPEGTATHLYSTVIVGMQLPKAIELLVMAPFEELKFKVGAMAFMPAVRNSAYGPKVSKFRAMLDDARGAVWAKALLFNLKVLHQGSTGAEAEDQGEEESESTVPAPTQSEVSSEEFARRSRESEAEEREAARAQQEEAQARARAQQQSQTPPA